MKTVLNPYHFLTAQDLATSFTSSAFTIEQADVAAIQLNYTGSPVGTIEIQASLDGSAWTSLYISINGVGTTTVELSTSTSPLFVDLYGTSFPYIRVKYTSTSGSGTLEGYITYKRLGG